MGTISLRDAVASLPDNERQQIAERAEVLKAEVRSLSDLRKAQEITQVELAKSLGISQASVARIEKRSDMLLSTLGAVLAKMGGELVVMAKFDHAPPVHVRLANVADPKAPSPRRRAGHKRRLGERLLP